MLGFAPIATTAICELPAAPVIFTWYRQPAEIARYSFPRATEYFVEPLDQATFSVQGLPWYIQHPAISRYQTPLDHFLTSRSAVPVVPTPIGKMWADAIQSSFSGFEEVQPLLR